MSNRRERMILTAEYHRRLAARLRLMAGKPGHATKECAEEMAQNHDTIARGWDARARQPTERLN